MSIQLLPSDIDPLAGRDRRSLASQISGDSHVQGCFANRGPYNSWYCHQDQASLRPMAIEQQKAVATAQMESLPVSDNRQRMAARLAVLLRDAGYNCEVVAALPIH